MRNAALRLLNFTIVSILWLFLIGVIRAQQPQVTGAPPQALQGYNSKWANGIAPGYYPTCNAASCTTLTLHIGPGTCFDVSSTRHTYAGGTLALTASSTNYIYLDFSSCTVSKNVIGYPVGLSIPLATVPTGISSITSITDDRTWFGGAQAFGCGMSFTGDVTNSGCVTTVGVIHLSPTPTLCTAGSYARGIDANGNATGCTAGSSGTVTNAASLTNNQLILGAGGNAIKVGDLSGDVSTSGSAVTTVLKINGGSVPSGAVANQMLIATAANTYSLVNLPDCQDTSGNHWNYNSTTHVVSCGTSSSGGGSGTVTSIATTLPITGGTIVTTGTIGCATCVTSAAALTSNQLMLGAGSQASQILGSLGTTTTVLHGNASGVPSFGAVANADLVNPSTTVNGTTCTLGSSCSVSAGGGGGGTAATAFYCTNNGTGTTLNGVARMTNSSICQDTQTGDATTIALAGIIIGGAGTTGFAQAQYQGSALCDFDGATTKGDTVTWSSTANHKCHDTGSTDPPRNTTRYAFGRVETTNGAAGTYMVDLGYQGATDSSGSTSNPLPMYPLGSPIPAPSNLQQLTPNNGTLDVFNGKSLCFDNSNGGHGATVCLNASTAQDLIVTLDLGNHAQMVVNGAMAVQATDLGNCNGGATIAMYNGPVMKFTLTGTCNVNNPTNLKAGEIFKFIICQDATGGRTITWPGTSWITVPTVPATASSCHSYSFTAFDTTHIYHDE